ncbi:MAG: hypothetical protein JSR47_15320 [Proteobacteria bacterium]|nr:hypothetical protein [Pseudomonadota bacterium]
MRSALLLVLATLLGLPSMARADAFDWVSIDGMSCHTAMDQAWNAARDSDRQCDRMWWAAHSRGEWDRVMACRRETTELRRRSDAIRRQCSQLLNQYTAWRSATWKSVNEGRAQAAQHERFVGENYARVFRRVESATSMVGAADGIVSFLRAPPSTPKADRYRQVAGLVSEYGDLLIANPLSALMFGLSARAVVGIADDAARQFDQAMQASSDLGRIDAGTSVAFPLPTAPIAVPGITPPPTDIVRMVTAFQGTSPADGPALWFAELQRLVSGAQAIAAANQARAEAERAEAAAARRQAADRAARAEARAEAERVDREIEEESRERWREFQRMQDNASGPLTFPTFPAPTMSNPTYRSSPNNSSGGSRPPAAAPSGPSGSSSNCVSSRGTTCATR